MSKEKYLGYLYENGYHMGAVVLKNEDEVVDFVLNNPDKDKIVTDILDNFVLNSFGNCILDCNSQSILKKYRKKCLKMF